MDLGNMALFIGLNFIMVILSSLRSITTAKSGRHVAAFFNVTSYTFYAAIVYYTSGQELWFVIATTAFCNLIGYYLADIVFCKMQKDKLWRISATFISKQMEFKGYGSTIEKLDKYNIKYTTLENNNMRIVDIYSNNQSDSKIVKEILENTKCKYHVIEIDKKL